MTSADNDDILNSGGALGELVGDLNEVFDRALEEIVSHRRTIEPTLDLSLNLLLSKLAKKLGEET